MTESELREKIGGLPENEFFEAHLRSKGHRRLCRYAVGRCCTLASTSSIPRTATARDGSSEKPADESADVGTLQ